MVRGYQIDDIKGKLVDVLRDSKTGLSGLEISERLGINRLTMTKYLKVFAAEGLLKQKNIGNVNLWFIEDGTEQYHFPEDLFKIILVFLKSFLPYRISFPSKSEISPPAFFNIA